jgi:hypothetical protein
MAPKLYIIRKYVMASSVKDALRKEKDAPIEDVWVDEDWKKDNQPALSRTMGF